MENIAFSNGDCTIKEESIQCKIGQRLTDPDATVEIDMSEGRVASIEVENEDVEFETNTRGRVALVGGHQSDEFINEEGKLARVFKNTEILKKGDF